ncbi:putative pentatricopeptide repeat-containing protein, mitochondrial-like [Capsicum annuum]|nr:putative pentatricopeptide repeat-containing protein, mitochondrial-like [Capsicum annuum]
MQLFGEISQRGSKPDTVTYNTILQGLFVVGRIGDAKNIYVEMLSRGRVPNSSTHRTLLNGYFRLPPDARTYNVMINGFCLNGLFDEVKCILRKMEDYNCPSDNITYNVIVQGFLRCNKISEIASFMKEMDGRGFSFDATTTELLVKAFSFITSNEMASNAIAEAEIWQLERSVGFQAGLLRRIWGKRGPCLILYFSTVLLMLNRFILVTPEIEVLKANQLMTGLHINMLKSVMYSVNVVNIMEELE